MCINIFREKVLLVTEEIEDCQWVLFIILNTGRLELKSSAWFTIPVYTTNSSEAKVAGGGHEGNGKVAGEQEKYEGESGGGEGGSTPAHISIFESLGLDFLHFRRNVLILRISSTRQKFGQFSPLFFLFRSCCILYRRYLYKIQISGRTDMGTPHLTQCVRDIISPVLSLHLGWAWRSWNRWINGSRWK